MNVLIFLYLFKKDKNYTRNCLSLKEKLPFRKHVKNRLTSPDISKTSFSTSSTNGTQ